MADVTRRRGNCFYIGEGGAEMAPRDYYYFSFTGVDEKIFSEVCFFTVVCVNKIVSNSQPNRRFTGIAIPVIQYNQNCVCMGEGDNQK